MTTEYNNGAKYYLTRYLLKTRVIIITVDITHAVKVRITMI